MKDVIQNPPTTKEDVRILKIATCETVSGKSTLTYHVGCTADGDIQLRIYSNTAAGFFSKEWLKGRKAVTNTAFWLFDRSRARWLAAGMSHVYFRLGVNAG